MTRLVVPTCAVLCAIGVAAARAQTGSPGYEGSTVRSTIIPSGSLVKVKVLNSVGSDTAQIGDTFKVIVASDDASGLPTGTSFIAQVTSVTRATPKTAGELGMELSMLDEGWSHGQSGSESYRVASASISGESYHGSGHVAAAAAAGGGLLGFVRKRKLGDLLEGAALGALGGTAVDQLQKRAASDVDLKPGSEITVQLERAMKVKTVVVPVVD